MTEPNLISLITVSKNNCIGLIRLHKKLKPYLDSGIINWIIKDSGHCVQTKEYFTLLQNPSCIEFISFTDSGIYNALNTALKVCTSDFYMVLGSDDDLDSERISSFIDTINIYKESKYDIIVVPVKTTEGIKKPRRIIPLWFSAASLVASHSGGTIIRTKLHHKFGLYDESYSLLADSLFLTLLKYNKVNFVYSQECVLCEFSLDGCSSSLSFLRVKEAFKYQTSLGSSLILQIIIFFVRNFQLVLFKIYKKMMQIF
jgi:putative colanic acid biosynthesis glycosyltransferase